MACRTPVVGVLAIVAGVFAVACQMAGAKRQLLPATDLLPQGVVENRLGGFPYATTILAHGGRPCDVADVQKLRLAIGRSGAQMGRPEGASGSGNNTKRIRLWVRGPQAELSVARLVQQGPNERTPT